MLCLLNQANGAITDAEAAHPLNVDFKAVCDAVQGVIQGNGETVTEIATRFGVSRGWIWKWVYPALKGREKEAGSS